MAFLKTTTINRNIANLRMIYFQEVLKVVQKQPTAVWEDTCLSILDDNNELNKTPHKQAFSYNGEYFPPSASNQKRSVLNKVSGYLHESLEGEFEDLYKNYVEEWNVAKREFKNLLSKAMNMAKNTQELSLVIPSYVLDQVTTVDFIPKPNAQGLSKEDADELLKQYPNLGKVHQLSSLGNIL